MAKLLAKTRLVFPVIYIILMCTVFGKWAQEYEPFAIAGLVAVCALVVVSWVVSAVRFIRKTWDEA